MTAPPRLELTGVSKYFATKVPWPREPAPPHVKVWRAFTRQAALVRAVEDVSFAIAVRQGTAAADVATAPS